MIESKEALDMGVSDIVGPQLVDDETLLEGYGVLRVPISSSVLDREYWATELSRVTPMNAASEDGEYAFYRNIVDEPNFPFDMLHKDLADRFPLFATLQLDDAFCIQYNTAQDDTTCAKHMDPSDVTVNMCLEKTADTTGSHVLFYGTQSPMIPSANNNGTTMCSTPETEFQFLVEQKEAYATIHWGKHSHMTTPLKSGRRTNIILTYCFADKSDALNRTCYATS
eukprot:scaffold93104_cov42-Attheya_sp.AAC.1